MATHFDQRRAWLNELLALAEELGVEIVIMEKPLSWNGGEWNARGE